MFWGCFVWNRLGPLIVCGSGGIGGDEYFEIFSDGLLSFVDDLFGPNMEETTVIRQPNNVIFMHDGAPCHRSPAVAELLAEEGITVMWPAQSPDLNPIENVWQTLKVKFHKRFTDFRCSLPKSNDAIEKYGEVLKEIWSEINPTVLSNLIRSTPSRVQAVIKAKGGPISY
jgi:transposase